MSNNDKKTLLHLELISGIGSAVVHKICRGLLQQKEPNAYNDDVFLSAARLQTLPFSSLYEYSILSLQKTFGFSVSLAEKIKLGLQDKAMLDQELEEINANEISLYTVLDDDYPPLLRTIYLPPLVLYVNGELPTVEKKHIAFVGSRDADSYAKKVVDYLVPPLVQQGWYIVSGGAVGVDTLAHQAALQQNGRTIAVLGSGILNPYPALNKDLFDEIVEQEGAVISSFPLHAFPQKQNFPARNRIIAGLSQGTVVVRAASKSGALITAQFSLEQGRHVFAVPGSIFDELSQGCHKLLMQGAKPVSEPNDILEEFGDQAIRFNGSSLTFLDKQETLEQTCNENEDPIMCHVVVPITFDELCLKTGLDFDDLQDKLFQLQLSGKIKQNFAGFWEKTHE